MVSNPTWNMEFDGKSPIYEQVIQGVCRALVRGEILPGGRIPSVRDMAVEISINANTIQRSYQEMERRGLIFARRGVGYFIVEDVGVVERVKKQMVSEAVQSFLEQMSGLGLESSEILAEMQKTMEGWQTDVDAS